MADQIVSSLSNALVFLLVARSFESNEAVGAFGLAMTAYLLVLGALRAVVGEPLLSLYSAMDSSKRRPLTAMLMGSTLLIGVVASFLLGCVSVLAGGLSGQALGAVALVLPAVLIHDSWRYVFVVDKPGAALTIDLVWLTAVLVVMPFASEDADVAWFIVVWGLGGALGGIAGFVLNGGLPGRISAWRWLSDNREVGGRFFGEFVVSRGVFEIALGCVGIVAGLGALGVVKGSLVFYGALYTLHGGIALALIPEGVRLRDDPTRLSRMLAVAAWGMVGVTAAWATVGLALPASWGRFAFGSVWDDSYTILVPMGVAMMGRAVMNRGLFGLRSLADARGSLRARLMAAPCELVLPVTGAALGGAGGFAIGLAMSQALSAIIWSSAFRSSLRRLRASRPAVAPAPLTTSVAGTVPDL